MSDVYGWTGRILRVDLSSSDISTIDTLRYAPAFIGGVGIGARLAWEALSASTDAFDAENTLMIMVGPLTGTLASGAGRVEVLGIAAQQHPPVFSRSGMGGHWGAELKYAGYDGVAIQGKAREPSYLWIHGGQAEICSANRLWGTGTFGTTQALRSLYGPQTRVISCGQAGERLSRIAIIQTETGNAAGQGGFGAVMGSKNLKAIAVRGTMGVPIARPHEFLELCLHASREGQWPGSFGIRGQITDRPGVQRTQEGDRFRLRKCGFCMTPCAHEIFDNVHTSDGLAVPSVARHCWAYMTPSPRTDAAARALTGDYGLNGWEITYGMIPWLQMCKQRGLIEEIDGIEIPAPERPIEYMRDTAPCSSEFLHMLVRKIAFREDELGDALAEGTCYAAERLFRGEGIPLLDRIYPRHCGQTAHWTGHWGPGGRIHFPWWLPPLLQWCVDTRDPASDSTHQWAEHVLRYLSESESRQRPLSPDKVRAVCAQVYGDPNVCDASYTYDPPELKARPAIWHSHRGMIVNSLVLCDREHSRVFSTSTESGAADTALMSRLFSACTGYDLSEKELDRVGERIWNQLRAIDVRYFRRSRTIDESTIDSFMHPGKDDGVSLDRAKFLRLLDTYYELSGWHVTTGCPTRAKLEELGLGDIADELEEVEKLDWPRFAAREA